jgi:hypothetical protein
MLTKWGAALGLASAGRVVASGGGNTGVPLGPFLNWAALPASAQDESFAVVLDLGPTNSYGLATYNASAGQWKLLFGYFETLADLNAFTDPKALTAVAAVGPSLDEPDSVRYQWDDPNVQWLRTPDPVHYLYPQATDWADLPAEDTVQNMDEAKVGDLGYMHSSGIAERHGNAWELLQGKFQNVADMNDFDDTVADVRPDAIALVKAGGGHDEEAIAYSYQGSAWVRFGATTTAGYAWTITSLSQADPSGIGATQIGDYGTFADPITGAINVYRLATINIASGAGSGTVTRWIPEDVYGRANLQVVAYCVGNETMPGYGSSLRGYTYDRAGAATIGTVSGYMRLDAPAPGSGSQFAYMTGPNIIGSKRFYIVSDARGVTTGTVGQAGFFNSSLVPQSQWTLAEQRDQGSTMRPIFWNGSAWAPASTSVRNGTGNTLSASDPWIIEGWSAGTAITDMMVTRVNGQVYTSLVRNFDSATLGTNFAVVMFAIGNATGTSSGRFEIRNHYVMTYD